MRQTSMAYRDGSALHELHIKQSASNSSAESCQHEDWPGPEASEVLHRGACVAPASISRSEALVSRIAATISRSEALRLLVLEDLESEKVNLSSMAKGSWPWAALASS